MKLPFAVLLSIALTASAIPQTRPKAFQYKWNPQSIADESTLRSPTKHQLDRSFPLDAYQPSNSTASDVAPYTGVVRKYEFTVSRMTLAPDGYEKEMIVVNGQFPGPQITADWGDTIEVTLHNNISGLAEGTALHYHGFLQSTSQWSDGVPGVTECPIAPGQTRVYTFQAQLYGSSWWHSHYSSQYADGFLGPIVINGPSQLPYDDDLGPVLVQDYYHRTYYDLLEDIMGTDLTKVRPASSNNLINGKGCSPTNSTQNAPPAGCTNMHRLKVEKGKKYRMRLVNTGAASIQKFSIDEHNMTVIAYDFVPIQPISQQIVTLGASQRADVIVEATGESQQVYWIRSNASSGQCTEPSDSPMGWAILQYEDAGDSLLPDTIGHVDTTAPCENDPLNETQPLVAITPGQPNIIENIDVNFFINSTGHFLWTMDNVSYRTNYNDPPLLLSKNGNNSYPQDPDWNIHLLNSTGSTRVILSNKTPTSHPMHLHGHNMYVLAAGTGTWDGTIINAENPLRRDVHLLPANGHLVVQFDMDNPGVWPFHCHIAWHVSGGLQITYVERPDDIRKLPIPAEKWGQCETWNAYTAHTVVDMIDSGT